MPQNEYIERWTKQYVPITTHQLEALGSPFSHVYH